jgi:hypothetical protein
MKRLLRRTPLMGAGAALFLGVAVCALAGSVGGAACATVPPEPSAAQPFNACPEHSCALYQAAANLASSCECVQYQPPATAKAAPTCAQQACVNSTEPTFFRFLTIQVSGGSFVDPGLTFVIADPQANIAQFATTARVTCKPPYPNAECLTVPAASALHGSLRASYDTTQTVGFNLGNGPGSETTLPVGAIVTPLVGTALLTAAQAGIGLVSPTVTQILAGTAEYNPESQDVGVGPYGAPALGYYAPVPVGTYDVTLQPGAPFDAFFPPVSLRTTVVAFNGFTPNELTVDPPSTRSTNVRSATALDGLVAYLRNANGDRISTRMPLHGQDAVAGIPLQLQTSGQPTDLTGDFFVIAPDNELDPGGRATFTNTALSITTGGLGAEQTYPQLPPPVTVAGQVLTTGFVPAAANVYLTSTGIARVDQSALDNTSLSYATSFATDACGNYSVTLPPGTYSARIAPTQGASAQSCGQPSSTAPAQTVTSLAVATTPAVQNGKSLQLQDAIPVTGTCRVADGRPLAAATVVLSASTSLAITPGTVPAPRTFTTITQSDGRFSADVDPGVYDVSIRPAAGSNLPWVVTTRQTVTGPSFAFADQVVPAPGVASYTFYALPDVTPLTDAVVTAYGMPASAGDGGVGSVAAVPVATGITDIEGNVNLLFSSAPQ